MLIREQDLRGLHYRREYERTSLASDVDIRAVARRAKHNLAQAVLTRMLGPR